jgi:DNA polymerase-1
MAIYTIGCEVGTAAEVEDCLNYFAGHEEIQIDTETSGLDPHKDKVTSLQIGDFKNQFFIDARVVDIRLFKDLIEKKLCILQNAKFDYKMLKAAGIMLNRIYDTMLAESVLFCGYEKYPIGLAALHQKYLNITLSKEEREGFLHIGARPFTLKQVEYGALDVTNLSRIRDMQMVEIHKLNLLYCVEIENSVVKAMGDIEYNGMILDPPSWNKVTQIYTEKLLQIQKAMDDIVTTEPKLKKWAPKGLQQNLFGYEERHVKANYGSPAQIKQMCHALGHKVESTDEREIGKLAKLDPNDSDIVLSAKHPFFAALLQNREIAKVVSTYGDSFLNYISPITGRVHTDIWQIKSTGRISSSKPNLQNLPAKNIFRNCFKARPGFSWVSIDYASQELVIMADQSGEPVFIEALNDKKDLHSISASLLFDKVITKSDKKERTAAKTITFGLCYGMGADKLSDSLDIPLDEAKDLMAKYEKAFPTVISWLKKSGQTAVKEGRTTTNDYCRRIRWYPGAKRAKELRKTVQKGDKMAWKEILMAEGSTEREGKNHLVQGSAANITKEALIEVRNLILAYNWFHKEEVAFLICQVHDAIDVEVRDDLSLEFSEKMAQIMRDCGNKYVTKVKMDVDVTITKEWVK